MSRKQARELREARHVVDMVDDVLENWGIEMHRYDDEPGGDTREPSERFTSQVGDGEAVEHDEVYSLIVDVALESYKLGRTAVGIPTAEQELDKAEAEVQRLRNIIKAAYSNQGWDIGSMKNLLIAGLEGYENSGWTRLHTYRTDHWGIGFSEGSSRDAWWVELALMDEFNNEHAVLALTDQEALELANHLDERVREGRKDWS